MSSAEGSGEQAAQYRCFQEWMELQERDLSELCHAFNQASSPGNDSDLKQLIDKSIEHFEGFIRLIYALSGKVLESDLSEYLQGKRTGNLGELLALQLTMVDELQRKTIKELNRITTELASLQEKISDHPIAIITQEMRNQSEQVKKQRRRWMSMKSA
ncbi:hypothetical protein RND71_019246 [Anisodus tanguticus]|uniref:Uncharacterized protein n=1 Tax=Anisodus tanguticus TaxID=243964 RepID=A0AAE1VGA2_9SOLA|nr:hypothetical protein RND71_019246 [Anisodus tanguticus]